MLIPVIQYHKIDVPARDALVRGGYTPPKRFARQMRYLKKQGFEFYSASELIEYYRERGSFPPRGITLTFDDGWRDNYTHAFPVLRELGLKATIFLVPSCIGQVSSQAQAEGESGRAHLLREEILEMSRHNIEFGSHSLNHKLLPEISLPEVKLEVEESKRQIEALVQKPCKVFAYPAGYFSEDAKRVIAEAGHIAAFSTTYGPTDHLDLYALNRIEILRRDRFLFQFMRKLKPLGMPMARL
ncbi:MAG TPA: polysaccharide deacetylase family protein [Pyrinomonadaceae bacterium]